MYVSYGEILEVYEWFMTRDQEDDLPDEKSSRANGVFGPFQDVYPKLYLE